MKNTVIDSDFNKHDFYEAFGDGRADRDDFYDFYLDGVRDQKDAEFYIENRFPSRSTLMDEVLDAFEVDITNAIKEGGSVVGLSDIKEWYKDDNEFNEAGTFCEYLKSFNTTIDEEDFNQLYLVNGMDVYVFEMKEA